MNDLKCNVEQRLQTIFLVASNVIALLPTFKVLQQKVRSNSCPVEFQVHCIMRVMCSWCALSFTALQVHDMCKTSSIAPLFIRFQFQV